MLIEQMKQTKIDKKKRNVQWKTMNLEEFREDNQAIRKNDKESFEVDSQIKNLFLNASQSDSAS